MFLASLGILAALAFVLGLGALAVWFLKRFSTFGLVQRSRIPVEVVQRVSLGPKAGLAVVRVGEKVVAVSVGDGGIRQLFELDGADKQTVLDGSRIALPMTSSAAATAAFSMSKKPSFLDLIRTAKTKQRAVAEGNAATPLQAYTSQGERSDDFRSMLRMSLRSTTKLAGVAIAVSLSFLSSESNAQVAPPVIPDSAAAITAATTQMVDSMQRALVESVQQTAATMLQPGTPPARPVGGQQNVRLATPATAVGNGSTATPRTPNGSRPVSDVRAPDASLAQNGGTASGAAAAQVAGGAEALAQIVPQMDIRLGNEGEGGLRLNGTVGIVVMMGLLTLLPTLLLMMTGFTRILIVLHFLKQAMGTQGAPPAHLLAGLALLLTGFVMAPTFTQMNREAVTPWLDGKMTQVEMMKEGVKPMRDFMLKQTRPSDLKTFVEMSRMEQPNTPDDVPLHVLMSAFVVSELRTAFQIGFAIYLPFIVIDAVVASVLMSMGMFMLPPAMISLPFKLLLFVLVDGWNLLITSLVQSFR